MGLGLRTVDVVEVVGGDERKADLGRQAEELLVEAALLGEAVVLQLEEEVARPQDLGVATGGGARLLPVVGGEGAGDLPVEAGRQPDQALGETGQVVAVDARLVVVAVDVGVGDEAAEVAIAGPVLRQQDQVEGLGVGLSLLLRHRAAGDVGLHPDDRLDPGGPAGLVEGDRAVEGAVVGEGERVEPQRRGLADQLVDPRQPVK